MDVVSSSVLMRERRVLLAAGRFSYFSAFFPSFLFPLHAIPIPSFVRPSIGIGRDVRSLVMPREVAAIIVLYMVRPSNAFSSPVLSLPEKGFLRPEPPKTLGG